ncbi:hypothetical protein J6590_079444 [Homalodisca vitripennis]|nr:hypothetical protein J6590_079444 [Homalodisca vitripennis]
MLKVVQIVRSMHVWSSVPPPTCLRRWRCDECSGESSSLSGNSDSEDSYLLKVLKNIQDDIAQFRKENSKSFATKEAT